MKATSVFMSGLKVTRCAKGNIKTISLILLFPQEQASHCSSTALQPTAAVLSLGMGFCRLGCLCGTGNEGQNTSVAETYRHNDMQIILPSLAQLAE